MSPLPRSRPPRRGALTRRAFAMAAAAASLIALSGCAGGPASGSANAGGPAEGTVTFLSWDSAQTMKPILDGFQKANPKITVQASYVPPVPQYIQTLQTRLGAGTAPDVFIITAENKLQIMNAGLAKDLTGESWTSNLAQAAQSTYTKDGKLYGAAVSSWGGGLLVNKDLLAKVGYSAAPQTWDDFLALCKKLKAAGITPFYEAGDGLSVSLAALLGKQNESLGGTMDQQIWGGKTTFAKAWTPALDEWNQLFTSGVESRSVAGLTGDQVTQQFEQGKVAMISTGSWGLGAIKTAAPNLKVEFLAVPTASGTYWAGAVSPGYAVNAKAKNPAAALKFVQYLTSEKGVAAYQKSAQAITTTKDYTPTLDPALGDMVKDVRAGKFYLPQVTWPDHNDVMATTATALVQQMITGKMTPAQVAAGMDAKLATFQ